MDLVERLRSGEDGLEYAAADEIERLHKALENISCPHMTQDPLWWQAAARYALNPES